MLPCRRAIAKFNKVERTKRWIAFVDIKLSSAPNCFLLAEETELLYTTSSRNCGHDLNIRTFSTTICELENIHELAIAVGENVKTLGFDYFLIRHHVQPPRKEWLHI